MRPRASLWRTGFPSRLGPRPGRRALPHGRARYNPPRSSRACPADGPESLASVRWPRTVHSRRFGDPLPEARRGDARHDARPRRRGRHRAGHGLGAWLPGLALLLRTGHPPARVQGVGGVDPPPHRGRDRDHGAGDRSPRRRRPSRSPQPHRRLARRDRPRRLPGLAWPRDGPPRQLGGIGHRPPRRRDGRRRASSRSCSSGRDIRPASRVAAGASASPCSPPSAPRRPSPSSSSAPT